MAELGEDAVAVAYLGQAYFLEDFVGEGVQGAVGLEVEGEEVVIARGLEKFQQALEVLSKEPGLQIYLSYWLLVRKVTRRVE